MSSELKSKVPHHNLDTSFVNLWALLRKLSQEGFIGRVRVELKDYSADVFMNGSSAPLVREVDRAAGTDTLEEAGLHRVVLRTRESPGSISIFEGAEEAAVSEPRTVTTGVSEPRAAATGLDQSGAAGDGQAGVTEFGAVATEVEVKPETDRVPVDSDATVTGSKDVAPGSKREAPFDPVAIACGTVTPVVPGVNEATSQRTEMVKASGELIGAVERAVSNLGADFASNFRTARVELADDYPFLDPTSGEFQYANSEVKLRAEARADAFVTGLSEVLRRVVNKVAAGEDARRVRERVALELALVARKRAETLKRAGFHDQLDRIAGTKVI